MSARRALERMPSQPLDELGAADDDPRLRSAEQLVAGEADEVGPGLQALARGRLVAEQQAAAHEERARAEVVDERQAVRTGDPNEVGEPRLLGEADQAEVGLVDAEQQRRLRADRAVVVAGASAVGRPDLAQPGARTREHVGNAESVADLDQLAARDEHFASLGQRGQREQHGCGVVVDDQGGLRAGQPPQDRGGVVLARAAAALAEVVLEVRVAARDRVHPLQCFPRERCAPEIGMDDHAGGVDRPSQTRPTSGGKLRFHALDEVARLRARLQFFTRAREGRSRRRDEQRPGRSARQPPVSRELVHGRQVPQLHGRSVER